MKSFLPASGLLAVSLSALSFPSAANNHDHGPTQDEPPLGPIVVTATRTGVPEQQVASAVTVIEREDIERSGKARVVELLRSVPGLSVIQSGGAGQVSSVFLRGTESNHVLVLIDGIEISDPSNPTGQVDFSKLLVEDIERIEIVRGPQSTLYGSDAIGGVIQIFTRRDDHSSYHLEIGEFATVSTGAALRRHFGRHRLGLSAGVLDTAGTSAANPDRGNKDEKDAFENATVSVHWATQATEQLELSLDSRIQQSESEIDEFYDVFPAPSAFVSHDPDSTSETDQSFSKLQASWKSVDGRWQQRAAFTYGDHERRNENGPKGARATPSQSRFTGTKTGLDWQHTLHWRDDNTLVFGAQTEQDKMRSTALAEALRTNSLYIQDQAQLTQNFSTTLGLRYDDHDQFGNETTWRSASLLELLPGTRLKGSYGTGFKAPSLSELFDNSFGTANPDLKPETSKGFDVGIEQDFGTSRLSVLYFWNEIDDLISFDPVTFQNVNIDRAKTRGYEIVAGFAPFAVLDIQLGYTRTRAMNLETDSRLLRRPEDEASIDINWQAMPKLRLGLATRYVGERDDFIGFTRGTLDSYEVVDINADYRLNPAWTLTFRVDNVNDEDYEETAGYAAPGRAAHAGVRWQSR